MPTYRMAAPDGQTYQIDGPDGASDDQVREQIIKQNPHLGSPGSGAPAPEPQQQQWQRPPSEGIIGAGINRLKRGGQTIADAIYPAAPAPPKSWGQFAKDTALGIGGGLMEASSAITAPLGELVRPAGEALGRRMAQTPEQVDEDISRLQMEKSRLMADPTVMAVSPQAIEQIDYQLDQARKHRGMPMEQQAYNKGSDVAMSAEILGGAAFGKPFKWRGPVAAETPAAAFVPRSIRGSVRPDVSQGVLFDPSVTAPEPAPPSAPVRATRPYQEPAQRVDLPEPELPRATEPAPTDYTVSERAAARTAPERPELLGSEPSLPTAAEVRPTAELGPAGQPRLLDAQGRQIRRGTPEPGQGTARSQVSPDVPEPTAPAAPSTPLKEASQIAEERTGGALPQKRKPVRFEEPEDAQLRLDQEAESGIERALRGSVEQDIPDTPTTRLMREGKSISGGSGHEDVGWMSPEGKEISHLGKAAEASKAAGRPYEMTHVEALQEMGLGDDMAKAFASGMVRYVRAGNQLNVETGAAGIDNAIKYISSNGRNARGGVIIELTEPNGGMLESKMFDRPWQAIEYLKSKQTPVEIAKDAAMNQQARELLKQLGDEPTLDNLVYAQAELKGRKIRPAKPISGGSDAPIEQPLKSAREIGMRRKTKESEGGITEPSPSLETPKTPLRREPEAQLGSDNKTPLNIEAVIKQQLPEEVRNLVGSKRVPKGNIARWKARIRKTLPQEEFVNHEAPNSPVITEMAWHHAAEADRVHEMLQLPWVAKIKKLDPENMKQLEQTAVELWEASDKSPAALEKAIASWPEELKEYVKYRNARLADENLSRQRMKLPEIEELPGPYLPHVTDSELSTTVNMGNRSGGHGLQTSVKGAGEHRTARTMLEGQNKMGIEYIDPRNAILFREWNGIRMTQTERLVTALKNRALYETQEAAMAASKTGEAIPVTGMPGADVYWAGSKAEALFLAQNIAQRPTGLQLPGAMGNLKNYADLLFRNPNLINPAPHITKNMWAKYILSSGDINPMTVVQDGLELFRKPDLDTVKLFREFMPYADADPAYAQFQHALVKGAVEGSAQKALDVLAAINKPSSHVIFKWGDPTMRYSLFKKYIKNGQTPQEAANNAWVDLVNYGTRSDLVDFWKSIPMNFFVPWRVGSVTSVGKQALKHPVRAALVIGGIDILREYRYRETGRWTHLPWDYFEGPLVTVVEAGLKGDITKLGFEAFANAMFGPSGEATAGNLKRMVTEPQSAGELGKHVMKVFWGLAQLLPSAEIWTQFEEFTKTGDPSKIVNSLMSALVAERDTKGYKHHSISNIIPEELMPYDYKVKYDRLTNPANE